MNDRRKNETLAYHVRTARRQDDHRREYMADRRIKRLLPRVFYTPADEWGARIAWPWMKARITRFRRGFGSR